MPISEAQLDTWSHQGAIQSSSNTYAIVKAALEDPASPYIGRGFEVFLQGSYRNDTNIYAESDVDIVIKLDTTFYYDISKLQPAQSEAFHANYPTAPYSYADFKREVLQHLRSRFPGSVTEGEKAIKIAGNGARRNCDVVVATDFFTYSQFLSIGNAVRVPGICLFTTAGERIINYPKKHAENLTGRHQGSNFWLKPMIRIFKNARGKAIADGLLAPGVAPSYYIECLLYNVPFDNFGPNYVDSYVKTLLWLNSADRSKLACANMQYWLFGEVPHVTWNTNDFDSYLAALINLWAAA